MVERTKQYRAAQIQEIVRGLIVDQIRQREQMFELPIPVTTENAPVFYFSSLKLSDAPIASLSALADAITKRLGLKKPLHVTGEDTIEVLFAKSIHCAERDGLLIQEKITAPGRIRQRHFFNDPPER